MKNLFIALLVASMFSLSACDSSDDSSNVAVSSPAQAPTAAPQPTPTVTVTATPAPVENITCAVYDLSTDNLGNGYLPDFDSLTPVASISLGTVNAPSESVSAKFQLFPADVAAQLKGAYGLDCDSVLNIETAGTYSFVLSSDDGSGLFVDGSPVIANNGPHGMTAVTGNVNLTAGKHKIHLEASQNGQGAQGLELGWEQPGDQLYTLIPAEAFSQN